MALSLTGVEMKSVPRVLVKPVEVTILRWANAARVLSAPVGPALAVQPSPESAIDLPSSVKTLQTTDKQKNALIHLLQLLNSRDFSSFTLTFIPNDMD